MNKIVIAITGLLLLFSLSSLAQKSESYYIEVGGGTQVLFSTDVTNLDLKRRLTPSISLTGGKWFSPVLGARLQLNGYSLNGYSTTEGLYLNNPLSNGLIFGQNDLVRDEVTIRPDGSYRHYLRYVNAHIDIQTSLFNLFSGYDPERKFDIIPALGLGYFRTLEYKGTPATNNISTNLSVMFKYSINKKFDVNLEAHGAVLPGSFDGRITRKMYEGNAGLNLGITYSFGSKPKPVEVVYPTTIEIVKDTVLLEKIVEKEVVRKEKRDPFVLASVRFALSQFVPLTNQETTLVNVVSYLKTNPNTKIRLDGYGDKETGSTSVNLAISIKRANNIQELLTEKYGINPQRIEVRGLGAEIQPYQENDWNRVVVITAIEE